MPAIGWPFGNWMAPSLTSTWPAPKKSDRSQPASDLPSNRLFQSDSPKVLAFQMSGKLHDEDYKKFVPMIDDAVAREGKVRLLALFKDFHGWDMHALWDDIKFSTTHCTKIERIALVGEKTWEKW